ncbi:MAG: HAMP domain-containing histidine kinase, partial [Myxococcales bacterium]|nr:HAMP domain-containing histidine kinase [Myxococcales bacterium]
PGPALREPGALAAEHAVSLTRAIGTRPWTLRFVPTRRYIDGQVTWQAWVVLAGGLTFTGLLGAFLLVMTGRAALEADRLAEVAAVNEQLRVTNEALSGFAYAASHDLKSPLRGISQLAEFLIEDHGAALPEAAHTRLTTIRERAGWMMRLLDDLLAFSRAGWLEEKPETVDTAELVGEILSMLPESHRFRVSLHGLPEFETLRVPLAQVFQNLLANAMNHHHRETGKLEVRCEDAGAELVFRVCDDGPGIPPRSQERVFELFRTLRAGEPGARGGTGMGLAMVRKIVGHAGGRVWVESDGVSGTRFAFTWPKRPRGGTPAANAR